VAFYNGAAFNNSPAGRVLAQATGDRSGCTQVVQVAAFLRVINALENLRQSVESAAAAGSGSPPGRVDERGLSA
jgi:hypothetical protein